MFSGELVVYKSEICWMIAFHCFQTSAIYSSVTKLQSPTIIKVKTPSRGLHYVKSAETRAFHDPYFPVHGWNRVRIFLYLVRFSNSVQIRENTNMNLSIYGKLQIKKAHVLAYLAHCLAVPKFYNGLI